MWFLKKYLMFKPFKLCIFITYWHKKGVIQLKIFFCLECIFNIMEYLNENRKISDLNFESHFSMVIKLKT